MCDCGCNDIPSLEQIIGPAGPMGSPGATVIYNNISTLSTSTTGSDVLMSTNSSTLMPTGTKLPASSLLTNGDYLLIEVLGDIVDGVFGNKQIKIRMGSTYVTVLSIPASLVTNLYKLYITIQRISPTQVIVNSHYFYNSTSLGFPSGTSSTVTLSSDAPIEFYINQSVGNSISITNITISKFIF